MSNKECNYCIYQNILFGARQKEQTVTTKPKPMPGIAPNGVDVFVDGRWAGWFMELPDHCCC